MQLSYRGVKYDIHSSATDDRTFDNMPHEVWGQYRGAAVRFVTPSVMPLAPIQLSYRGVTYLSFC